MLQHRSQAMAVDLLFAEQPGFQRETISKEWTCRQFADQCLARGPFVLGRRLREQPGGQAFAALRRDRGIEQLEQ